MGVYAEKPWLKSYTLGPFKLEPELDCPRKPLFSLIDDAAAEFPTRTVSSDGNACGVALCKSRWVINSPTLL